MAPCCLAAALGDSELSPLLHPQIPFYYPSYGGFCLLAAPALAFACSRDPIFMGACGLALLLFL